MKRYFFQFMQDFKSIYSVKISLVRFQKPALTGSLISYRPNGIIKRINMVRNEESITPAQMYKVIRECKNRQGKTER